MIIRTSILHIGCVLFFFLHFKNQIRQIMTTKLIQTISFEDKKLKYAYILLKPSNIYNIKVKS